MQNLWTGSVAGRGGGERGWAAKGPASRLLPRCTLVPGQTSRWVGTQCEALWGDGWVLNI